MTTAPKTNLPVGPFTLWVHYGCDGWSPRDYQTLDAAVADIGTRAASEWVITKAPVKLVEAPEAPLAEDEMGQPKEVSP